jgi:hypothetical protein
VGAYAPVAAAMVKNIARYIVVPVAPVRNEYTFTFLTVGLTVPTSLLAIAGEAIG